MNLIEYWPYAIPVYIGVGFLFCHSWMRKAAACKVKTGKNCYHGCEGSHRPYEFNNDPNCQGDQVTKREGDFEWLMTASLLSVPLWPINALCWAVWKPFDLIWRNCQPKPKSVTVSNPKGHVHPRIKSNEMTEEQFQHFMECQECREARVNK